MPKELEFVRRPLLWVLIYGALIVYGIVALIKIPVEVLPQFDVPQISVVAHLPGATTQDLETLVAKPIETEVFTLNALSGIRAAISQGTVQIDARFVEGTSAAAALQAVNSALERTRSALPQGTAVNAEIAGNAINEVADYAVRIPGGVSSADVQKIIETIVTPRLRALPGVQRVSVFGPGTDAIWIQPDLDKLQQLNVSTTAIANAVQAGVALSPSGYLTLGHQDVFMEGRSLPTRVAQFGNMPVPAPQGAVPLESLARIIRAPVPAHSAVSFDNHPTVAFVVFKQPGASTVPVIKLVQQKLDGLKGQLPAGVQFVQVYSQGHLVQIVGNDLGRNLAIGALLAMAVLFWLLGAGRGIWALALSIPLSLLLGIAGLHLAGQTLNLLTLGALSVAVGLLADDAIIVLESIYHRWEQGDERWQGIAQGLRDIAGPDISGTMTTVAVFIPLLFVGGLAGLFFVPFSLAMTVALIASLFISLTLIPLLLGALGPQVSHREHSGTRVVAWLKRHNFRLFDLTLRHPKAVLSGCIGMLAVSIAGVVLVPVNFLPLPNEAVLLESFTMPPGTSLGDVRAAIDRITQRLLKMDAVAHVFARIGSASGTVYTEPAFAGELQIVLKPDVNANNLDEIGKQALNASHLPAMQTTIGTPTLERVGESLSGLPQPFVIDLYGDSVEKLRTLSDEVTRRLKGVPNLADVFNNDGYPITELQITPKPQAMALHGISPTELYAQLQPLLLGKVLATVPEGNSNLSVYLRASDPSHLSLSALQRLPVMANGWATLGDLADIKFVLGPNLIRHLDGVRAIEILATPQAPLGQVIASSKRALANLQLPPGYEVRFGGLYPQLEQAALNLGLAALAAFVLMIGILALQFDGFLVPGLLLTQIPLAFSGGALALVVSGVGLNAISLIAFLTLIGISLNHGIVLLQLVKKNEAKGFEVHDAVRDAVNVRFRPILLTVLTGVLGLLPTALGMSKGAAPEQGLAVVTLGGLIWSGLLSTNLIPALYVLKRAKAMAKLRAKP